MTKNAKAKRIATATTRVDRMFRAFSNRTRLRILSILRSGETCVCDLVDILGVPQPTASRHLAHLRRSGLVVARKQGLWNYYLLAPAKGKFHEKLLVCLASCFDDVPQLSEDSQLAKARKCSGGCCE